MKETDDTKNTEKKGVLIDNELECKTELIEKKNAKDMKKTVTFGEDTVEIIDGKEQEDPDVIMAMDLSLDKDTSTEQEASIESNKSTDGSSQ